MSGSEMETAGGPGAGERVSARPVKGRSRAGRVLRFGFRSAVVLAVVGVGAYVGVRWAVWSVVARQLAAAGYPAATFRLAELTLSRATVADLRLDPGAEGSPRVGLVEVEYKWRELLGKKVRGVTVSGVTATVDVSSGVPRVVGVSGENGSSGKGGGGGAIELPRVELRASSVLVRGLGGVGEMIVPVEGKYEPDGKGGGAVSGTVGVGPAVVRVGGVVGKGGSTYALTGEGSAELEAVRGMLPGGVVPRDVHVSGVARVRAVYDSAGHAGVNVNVEGGRVAYVRAGVSGGVTVEGMEVVATGSYEPAGGSASVTVSGEVRTPYLDGPAKMRGEVKVGSLWPLMGEGSLALVGGGAGGMAVTVKAEGVQYDPASGLSGSATIGGAIPVSSYLLSSLREVGVALKDAEPIVGRGELKFTTKPALLVTGRLSDLSVAAGAMVAGGGGVTVNRPRVGADSASVVVTGSDVTVVTDGLVARAGDVVAGGAGGAMLKRNGNAEVLSVAVPSMSLRYGFEGGMSAAFRGARVRVEPSDLEASGVRVAGLRGDVSVNGESEGGRVRVRLEEGEGGSALSWSSAEVMSAGWKSGSTRVTLTPAPARGAVVGAGTMPASLPSTKPAGAEETLPLFAMGAGEDAAVAVHYSAGDVSLEGSGLKNRVGELAGALKVSSAAGGGVGLDGFVSVQHAEVSHAASGLTLEDVSLRLPVNLDAMVPREGSMHVGRVKHNGADVRGDVTARMFVTRSRLWADVTWPLLSEGEVKASADFYFLPQARFGIAGTVKAWVPRFEFTKAAELRALLPGAIADADVTGRFDAEVGYSLGTDGTEQRWGTVNVENASLNSKSLDADLSGVSGLVSLRSFDPLESHPGQRLSVKSARLGKYAIRDGGGHFRLDPGGIIFVEDAAFAFAGGEVSARGFRIQPSRQAVEMVVYADGLDLGKLASTVSDGRVNGTGKVYARLPVSVVWPERIRPGTGYVYAEGGDGRISLGVNAADVAALLGASAQGDANQQLLKERITGALTSFGYSQLSLTFTRDEQATDPAKALIASLRFAGKGPEKLGGQVLDLTFNFTGVEDLLSAALLIKRGSGGGR